VPAGEVYAAVEAAEGRVSASILRRRRQQQGPTNARSARLVFAHSARRWISSAGATCLADVSAILGSLDIVFWRSRPVIMAANAIALTLGTMATICDCG